MTYAELTYATSEYRSALLVEAVISAARLRRTEKWFRVLAAALLALSLFARAILRTPFLIALFPEAASIAERILPALAAIFAIALGLWLAALLLRSFHQSAYFKDLSVALPEPGMRRRPLLHFEAAEIANHHSGEPLLDFFLSRFGAAVCMRLGLSAAEVRSFLQSRSQALSGAELELHAPADTPVGLPELADALVRADEGLRRFLAGHAIDDSDFFGAAAWVSRGETQYKASLRWWARDALGRIPGLGKDWGYGETATLERYATELSVSNSSATAAAGSFGARAADEVERILSRGREANVLLVGEEGVPLLAPLALLARCIVSGTVLPPLEHKRIFVLDAAPFVSAVKEKQTLEAALVGLLAEAARAGNIIFVINHFDSLVAGAKELGSDILAVVDEFLASPQIQIVATTEIDAFHQLLEPNPHVKERFERVLMEGGGVAAALPLLEDEAVRIEVREGVFFTYQALRAVAESADRYFFEGVMPDKAIDLLSELAPKANAAGKRLITKEDVLDLVSQKTGIATGQARGEERTKLLRLEEALHERIVGQDEAVRAISGALRRARSGIGNPNRPLGSFLFLGPTGVGKTETTKALAAAFFGDESRIIRFDMSEYQSEDALRRLIGEFAQGKAGVLASALREHPFGVLLLDEFEKTNKDVHDLFLQILDEGFFTDASGKRVNARNLMIIATSNAASDLIWRSEQKGRGADKDVIITDIINRGIFKPELLNRFDGIVLFSPLSAENLRIIARLQLQKLAKRLEEKGIELAITEPLLDFLVSVGQDPKFGARPMNRAIQEKVEQVIAERMLRGEIAAGARIELSSADLALPQNV